MSKTLQQMVEEDMAKSFRQAVDDVFKKEYFQYQQPNYYPKRRYGKWAIYNKDGWRVAHGMNEKQMKAYMKLLEEKE